MPIETPTLSRRGFLTRSAAIGCSLAASPLVTPVSFAAAPWDTRLVVILLRGGMDGLDVVQPYGDPAFSGLRKTLLGGPENDAIDLDGYFSLHPALVSLMPLWEAGDLGFVHATSTPYRDKRSHFDGQDLLEAGTAHVVSGHDGWLNRMIGLRSDLSSDTAYALGRTEMKMLIGPAPHSTWAPDSGFEMSPQAMRLAELIMKDDEAMAEAFAQAVRLSDEEARLESGMEGGQKRRAEHLAVADFAAQRLREDARIAAFSLNGWDMHIRQKPVMARTLKRLADTILALRDGMGAAVWGKTAVLAMTEFGRTVRENGTDGTDHGTGGAMLLAGGAINGGRVFGQWPGLSEADLYDRRDLMPTTDVRAHAAWMMQGLTGVNRNALENVVFPGVDMGDDPGLLL
ncbi:MAG: DUF1501 domain-containing protein [Pseudomonadota bacterium]